METCFDMPHMEPLTIEMAHKAAEANFNVTPAAPTCDDDDDEVSWRQPIFSIHPDQDSDL